MKTLQEIKDEVARKYGSNNWGEFVYWKSGLAGFNHPEAIDEVAKMYAEQAIDRAAEVVKITVNNGYEDSVDERYYDNCSNAIVSYCIEPNKESILKVKQDLK